MPAPEHVTTRSLPLPRIERVECGEMALHIDPVLAESCGVIFAFTERTGGVSKQPYGSLNLATHVGDDPCDVAENRRRLLAALEIANFADRLVVPNQVHSDTIATLLDAPTPIPDIVSSGADAIVCAASDVPVLLCFADCVPVVLVAPNGCFAIAHAGWRGALASIPGKTAVHLASVAGCPTSELNAYIGPHIGVCCYEVDEELLFRFNESFGILCGKGSNHLRLATAVFSSLVNSGVNHCRIEDCGLCTAETTERFFSHRAEKGRTGRHGAVACRLSSYPHRS